MTIKTTNETWCPESIRNAYDVKVSTWRAFWLHRQELITACNNAGLSGMNTIRLVRQWDEKQPSRFHNVRR